MIGVGNGWGNARAPPLVPLTLGITEDASVTMKHQGTIFTAGDNTPKVWKTAQTLNMTLMGGTTTIQNSGMVVNGMGG